MDYYTYIQDIITVLKQDKSVVQPWRNKGVARLEEVQAFIRMGKTTTSRQPDDLPTMQFSGPQCTCTELGRRKDCPAHGGE